MKRFFMSEDGQGMVEYGLIIALVAVTVMVALGLIGTNMETNFTSIADTITEKLAGK